MNFFLLSQFIPLKTIKSQNVFGWLIYKISGTLCYEKTGQNLISALKSDYFKVLGGGRRSNSL
jgi:hypothetical protein